VNILTVNLLFSTLVFWIAARIYVFPRLRAETTEHLAADTPPALVPTPRSHVPGARRHLPRHSSAVRLSGGLRRSAGRSVGNRCDSSSSLAGTKGPIPRVAGMLSACSAQDDSCAEHRRSASEALRLRSGQAQKPPHAIQLRLELAVERGIARWVGFDVSDPGSQLAVAYRDVPPSNHAVSPQQR